jgi:rsbT co-antagonist protein RsbR
MSEQGSNLAATMREHEPRIIVEWLGALAKGSGGAIETADLEDQARAFVRLLSEAVQKDAGADVEQAPAWSSVRDFLAAISGSRARHGFTPIETAMFIFSLKQPLFAVLRDQYKHDAVGLARETWVATQLLDRLGLLTTEVFQKSREAIIFRQQKELLELSTPVVALWEGILALPLIGSLDSERTQVVMENLLERIVSTGASIAIIDITGVPTVDTLVAQHLLKTVGAARLMGAECIISGIRPQIAQTIVHLGVDLGTVVTKATLASAFLVALDRLGVDLPRPAPRG